MLCTATYTNEGATMIFTTRKADKPPLLRETRSVLADTKCFQALQPPAI